MTAMVLTPESDVAKTMMASLKAGVPMAGKVCGLTTRAGEDFARVMLRIPLIGERVILARSLNLKVGECVMVRAQFNAGSKYQFIVERAEPNGGSAA